MYSVQSINPSFARSLIAIFSFAPILTLGQTLPALKNDEAPVAEKYTQLLATAENNNFDASKDPGAPAELKELFNHLQNPVRKEWLCYALLKMGDQDEVCRDFLSELGHRIVDSDIPEPYVYDENGNPKSDYLTPDFIEWAKNHNRSPSDVLEERDTTMPIEMGVIALSGDVRAIPILRKGMSSSNQTIQLLCAQGLTILQDKDSIELIIDAARRLPRNEQWALGRYLLYFNDPAAVAAGEETFTDKGLLEATKKGIKANGTLKPSLQGHLPFGGFH